MTYMLCGGHVYSRVALKLIWTVYQVTCWIKNWINKNSDSWNPYFPIYTDWERQPTSFTYQKNCFVLCFCETFNIIRTNSVFTCHCLRISTFSHRLHIHEIYNQYVTCDESIAVESLIIVGIIFCSFPKKNNTFRGLINL